MKTYQPKHKDIKRNWHMIDAEDEILGRMSTKLATLLMGKHKPTYSDHMDMGDYVVVINAQKVKVTGKKRKQKVYQKHSGYPGGFKEVSFEKMITEHPERVIELAVSRMLPGNRLRDKRMRRLKVFAGASHPYKAKFGDIKKEK
jgi:large subunit ribosomal protein L13